MATFDEFLTGYQNLRMEFREARGFAVRSDTFSDDAIKARAEAHRKLELIRVRLVSAANRLGPELAKELLSDSGAALLPFGRKAEPPPASPPSDAHPGDLPPAGGVADGDSAVADESVT